ncbi:response regulator transcription factor [Streptomyces sp. NA04227]|uniref:response regulator transcription factor n=1 Tax=Streptomyces sp. NA04227 TaxID=2742136 RepID=UPI001591F49A|nr:response regulator transcription factor [Streptomyces sp. NA04227]QKW06544.1 response regulator transcription factor [Streptomyces sp. NA04227]
MAQISSETLTESGITTRPGPAAPHTGESEGASAAVRKAVELPSGQRILVVDNDGDSAESLVLGLRRHGHEAVSVKAGAAALTAFEDMDLILLDLELPDLDGLEVCGAIRSVSRIPVIIVTARGTELDRVLGLQAGADDFLVKPYGFRELLARIEAVMRRVQQQPETSREIQHGPLRIDANSREVSLHGRTVCLTRKEFDVLLLLASHPDTVIPRKRLLQQVWGDSWSRRTIDTHVSSLRGKLGNSGWIVTVRGVGYRLGGGV